MNKLKKLRLFRFILFILILLISALPILVVANKYDIIKVYNNAPQIVKFSVWGIFIIGVLTLALFKRIRNLLKQTEFSLFKAIVGGVFYMIPLTILLFVLVGLSFIIVDLIYILEWVIWCSGIVLIILIPLFQWCNYHILRQLRINEIKEGVKG